MPEIKLTKGKVALVSEEDFIKCNRHKWTASLESRGTKWYAIRFRTNKSGKRVKVRLHRFVLGCRPWRRGSLVVDHKNHDGLDCQRENLEKITQRENMLRSKGWKRKGVKQMGKVEKLFRKAAELVDGRRNPFCCPAISEAGGIYSHEAARAQELFEEYYQPLPVVAGENFVMREVGEVYQHPHVFMEDRGDQFTLESEPELIGRRQTAMLFMAEIAAEQRL